MTQQSKWTGLCLVGGLAATALTTSSSAQDAPPAVNNGALTWAAGIDYVSQYIFRGIAQQDEGFIVQPYVEVGGAIGDTGLDFTLGTWSSVGSRSEGTGDSLSRFFETDLYASISGSVTEEVGLSLTYTGFFSPSQSFDSIEELAIGIDYDDSELFGDWAFSPYAFIAFEFRDEGGSEDIYLEIGGEFSAPFIESEELPVELTFPVVIGLSLDDFYTDEDSGDNEFFGYVLFGAAAGFPLDFVPSEYGTWSASAGVDFIIGNGDANVLDDGGSDFQVVGKFGVALEY